VPAFPPPVFFSRLVGEKHESEGTLEERWRTLSKHFFPESERAPFSYEPTDAFFSSPVARSRTFFSFSSAHRRPGFPLLDLFCERDFAPLSPPPSTFEYNKGNTLPSPPFQEHLLLPLLAKTSG